MEIFVTGAAGMLGSRVVAVATSRGHRVHVLSRERERGWLVAGVPASHGQPPVEAVIHCAPDRRSSRRVDVSGTAELVAMAQELGRPHLLFPGVVGSDVVPRRFHRSQLAVEGIVAGSRLPFTIQRFTEFHPVIWSLMWQLTRPPVAVVPRDTRYQVLDPQEAARLLVTSAERGPQGRLPDLGGQTVYEARDLARSVAAALGRSRRFLAMNVPGLAGAAFRAGANLSEQRATGGMTWNDYVAAQIAAAPGPSTRS